MFHIVPQDQKLIMLVVVVVMINIVVYIKAVMVTVLHLAITIVKAIVIVQTHLKTVGIPYLVMRVYKQVTVATNIFLNRKAPIGAFFVLLKIPHIIDKKIHQKKSMNKKRRVSFPTLLFLILGKIYTNCKLYLLLSSIATATATVAPTIGLLPIPISPIIST